jgi:hypothetical protein
MKKIIQTLDRSIGSPLTRIFTSGMPDKDSLIQFFGQPDDLYTGPVELVTYVCNVLCKDVTEKYSKYAQTIFVIRHMMLTQRLNLPEKHYTKISLNSLDVPVSQIHWRMPFIDFEPRLAHVCFCCNYTDFEKVFNCFKDFLTHVHDKENLNPFLSNKRFKNDSVYLNTVAKTYGVFYSVETVLSIDIFYVHLI